MKDYPGQRPAVIPLQGRMPEPPGPDAYAPPQHRPDPTVKLSDQDRLNLSQLLSTMENLIHTIDATRFTPADPQDAMAALIYDIPYRHIMEMATNLTKIEGVKEVLPEAQAALLFKWAVAHREKMMDKEPK